MPGILISVDKFDAWTPATTEIIDITDALLAKEWHVTLCTSSAGKLLQPELDRLAGEPHFQAITDASSDPGSHYDLIWIVKGFFSEKLLTALTAQRGWKPLRFASAASSELSPAIGWLSATG